MKQFKKLSHAVWQCKYHVVWCPKYRFRILRGKIGESVRDIIRQLCEWRNIEILEGNIQIDHIHLILSIPPKYSVSEAIGFLKGSPLSYDTEKTTDFFDSPCLAIQAGNPGRTLSQAAEAKKLIDFLPLINR